MDFTSTRNVIIAALIMVLAIGITYSEAGAVRSGSVSLSGLAVAAIVGILLNAVLPGKDYEFGIDEQGARGILTLTPCETAIIAADIATNAAEVEIGFLDRFTGSVIISGDVQSVQTALEAVTETLQSLLGFDTVAVTKT